MYVEVIIYIICALQCKYEDKNTLQSTAIKYNTVLEMEVQIGQSNAAKQQSKQPFLCQNKISIYVALNFTKSKWKGCRNGTILFVRLM